MDHQQIKHWYSWYTNSSEHRVGYWNCFILLEKSQGLGFKSAFNSIFFAVHRGYIILNYKYKLWFSPNLEKYIYISSNIAGIAIF